MRSILIGNTPKPRMRIILFIAFSCEASFTTDKNGPANLVSMLPLTFPHFNCTLMYAFFMFL